MTLWFKAIQILFITIFIQLLSTQGPPRSEFDRKFPYGSTFKSVACENFNVSGYGYIRNCSIKPYSRNHSTLNFGYTLNKKVDRPIFLRIVMFFRYGIIYREIFRTTIEICSILDNIDSQPLFKSYISSIQKSLGNHMHKCPYSGTDEFYNITIDETETKKRSMFPEGYFKVCLTLLKPEDKPIARLCPVYYVKSPMKESYGRK